MFTYFATEAASGGLLGALGIDIRLFLEQLVAFIILILILAKFVFPPLIRAVDKRQEALDATVREATEAKEALEQAEAKADAVLAEARKEAEAVIGRSQEEASKAIAEAETKAKARSEQIVADARTQLDADVRKAQQALKKQAVALVAAATEKVIGEKVDAAKDSKLIERSLVEAER